jgi:hypothetical protein
VRRRHPDVDQREVRLVLVNGAEELVRPTGLRHHLEGLRLQQKRDALSQ